MVLNVFLQSFLMVFLAEMGDKSQFLMVALTARYRIGKIMLGSLLAIGTLNLLAVTLGGAVGHYVPAWVVSLGAGAAFFYFSHSALGEEADNENTHTYRKKGAVWAVFCAYFLAELGDKTQLTALTLAAGEGRDAAQILPVFLGATVGLFLAGLVGLLIGAVLGKRLPRTVFARLSATLFFVCGVIRLLSGFESLFASGTHPTLYALIPTAISTCLFMILCVKERSRYGKKDAGGVQSVPQQ